MPSENPTIVGTAPVTNGNGIHTNGVSATEKLVRNAPATHQASFKSEASNLGSFGVKSGLAQMLKGGVIMVSISSHRLNVIEELT